MKNFYVKLNWIGYTLIFIILILCTAGCRRSEPPQAKRKLQPFRICMGGILAPLPMLAKEKGFFAAEGVAAEISLLGDGKAAMSGFLKGECDACLSGEFPVVKQSFERNDITIIATVSSSENAVKILARKDRGISKPIDLIGKKVGISKGTISNFFFDQFLKKNGISPKKLTIVDIPHNKVSDALKRGEIDAFAGSDVAYLKGRHLIGDTGVTFTEPGLTNHAACLTVKKDWLAANPDTAQRVLKALVTAEKELAGNSDEIPPMLAKELDTSVEDIKTIMADQHNKVSIDQVLILALEDEARWMLEMGMLKGKQVPNYLDFIDVSVLKKVNPDAVKLR